LLFPKHVHPVSGPHLPLGEVFAPDIEVGASGFAPEEEGSLDDELVKGSLIIVVQNTTVLAGGGPSSVPEVSGAAVLASVAMGLLPGEGEATVRKGDVAVTDAVPEGTELDAIKVVGEKEPEVLIWKVLTGGELDGELRGLGRDWDVLKVRIEGLSIEIEVLSVGVVVLTIDGEIGEGDSVCEVRSTGEDIGEMDKDTGALEMAVKVASIEVEVREMGSDWGTLSVDEGRGEMEADIEVLRVEAEVASGGEEEGDPEADWEMLSGELEELGAGVDTEALETERVSMVFCEVTEVLETEEGWVEERTADERVAVFSVDDEDDEMKVDVEVTTVELGELKVKLTLVWLCTRTDVFEAGWKL
jgi:hypothetical protein